LEEKLLKKIKSRGDKGIEDKKLVVKVIVI